MRSPVVVGGATYARGRRPTPAKVVVWNAPAPSTQLELRLYAALAALGVTFAAQKEFRPYRVDAFIPSLRLVIEADGDSWHGCPVHYPEYAPAGERKRERRDARLRREYGVHIAHLWACQCETELDTLRSVQAVLREFGR